MADWKRKSFKNPSWKDKEHLLQSQPETRHYIGEVSQGKNKSFLSTCIYVFMVLLLSACLVFALFGFHMSYFRWYKYDVSRSTTILISMDGFRYDYIEKVKASGRKLPNFDRLRKDGVKAEQVKNAFVTITMPNHQTLVTGLYPESHGFTLNTVIDPRYPNEWWEMGNQTTMNDPKYYVGLPEPIWVTCQQQGCLSASMLWPNTDAKVANDLPFQQVSQFMSLNSGTYRYPYKKRVDDVIWWLTNKRYHIDLLLMYFDEPDETGHGYGPNSKQVYDKVVELDFYFGYLIDLLEKNGIYDEVNIILTSDHGMEEISWKRQIALNDYVDPKLYYSTLLTPVSGIYPHKGHEKEVYNKLKGAHPNYHVYWKSEVPARLNYNHSDRIAPIIGISDEGWSVVQYKSNRSWIGGNHGYDNKNANMHPFFIARGPVFKQNYSIPTFESVDVYPLMCHLLNIRPNPNNGSLDRISPILKNKSTFGNFYKFKQFFVQHFVFIWTVMLIASILLGYLSKSS